MSSNIQNTQTRAIRSTAASKNIKISAPSRTDQLAESAHKIARDQLIPQVRKMTRNAITTDNREIYYYFKKTIGRECSCVKENNVPSGTCPVCFKTTWVGGFDKYGTHSETLDVTSPFISSNLQVNYAKRPNTLKLGDSFTAGYAIWEIPIKQNLGTLDAFQVVDYQNTGNIKYYILGSSWEELTSANIKSKLGNPKITVKAEFSRQNTKVDSPEFICARIRYMHRQSLWLNSDWEHARDSRALSEYGIYSAWQTLSVNIDDTIPIIRPEDWVYRKDRNEIWKIIESDRYDQLQISTGTNVTVRLIQPHEIYNKFPL